MLISSNVFYHMSEFYHPEYSKGVRWDDPAFSIEWPDDERIFAVKDLHYLDFNS